MHSGRWAVRYLMYKGCFKGRLATDLMLQAANHQPHFTKCGHNLNLHMNLLSSLPYDLPPVHCKHAVSVSSTCVDAAKICCLSRVMAIRTAECLFQQVMIALNVSYVSMQLHGGWEGWGAIVRSY